MFERLSAILAGLALALTLGLAAPAAAQEPVNPTASSVQEDALLEALGGDGAVTGRITIPNENAAALIKPNGRDWTALRNGAIASITVWVILGMLALLAIFFLIRGRIRVERGMAGRSVQRFNALERFAHWLTAVSFIVLALTGLNLVLGRHILLPLIGEGAFGAVTQFGKFGHNYLAWPFMLGLALILLLWIKDNIPSRTDGRWLASGGGFLKKGKHPPAHRFNAGQKLIFWSVVVGGAALSWTGILLLFPELAGSAGAWQTAQVIHGLAAAILTAVILGHIYIGTLGMEGAYSAMGSGKVDVNWAREHHSLWAEEKVGGKPGVRPVSGSGRPVAPAE